LDRYTALTYTETRQCPLCPRLLWRDLKLFDGLEPLLGHRSGERWEGFQAHVGLQQRAIGVYAQRPLNSVVNALRTTLLAKWAFGS
jgi:hypothetical protein